MANSYYGSRISDNIAETPEGFLVCHNVPLSRVGTQEYLGSEVGKPELDIVKVYRRPEEVFKKSAIDSFEGKPVTNDHPPKLVEGGDAMSYLKGVCKNVHRGTGEDSDKVIADLVIYDPTLISLIKDGKREISAGYTCSYADFNGELEQVDIVGNHVAVVGKGRAGSSVAIRDEKPTRRKKMAKKKQSILDRMFHVFVNDEDTTPEDIKEAADAVNELEEGETVDTEPTEDPTTKAIQDALKPIMDRLDALEAKDSDDEEDFVEDEDEDEDFLTDADEDEEEALDEDGEASPEEIAENLDHDTVAYMLKAIRPQIARMPAKDAAAITNKLNHALKRKAVNDDYDKLFNHTTKHSKQVTGGGFGEACRSRNPHFKGGK